MFAGSSVSCNAVTGSSGSSAVHDRQFTMVLPSIIEDSGDSGFSHLYLPCASLRLHQCGDEEEQENDEDRWLVGPNDLRSGHTRESSFSKSGVRSPLRSGRVLSSMRGGFGSRVGGDVNSTNAEAIGISSGGFFEECDRGVKAGLSKPRLSPSMIRFATPSEHLSETSIAFCMAPGCSTAFNLFHRRYRCKMCGKLFCFSCCSNIITVSASAVPVGTGNVATVGSPKQGTGFSSSSLFTSGKQGPTESEKGTEGPGENSPSSHPQESSPLSSSVSSCRVCRQCYYETHLVISKRQENGELRRRCRGEFKLFQRSLLLNIFSFLTQQDLAEVARVSSDFYFISRDNVIWYQYNMQRWIKEEKSPFMQAIPSSAMSWQAKQNAASSTIPFQVAPVLQDAASVSSSAEAAKRAISLHARYNYTQFLDYARRLEMAQRDGLTSFMLGMRILLSSVIRIAITGPSQVGKTTSIRAFLGKDVSNEAALPTVGFTRYVKAVRLRGAVRTQVTLHIYDISGEDRYEVLRRFICSNVHAIGICYDPTCKRTLVEAADMMMSMEESLGPQPVVVCGLIPVNACNSNFSQTKLEHSVSKSLSGGKKHSVDFRSGGASVKLVAGNESNVAESAPTSQTSAPPQLEVMPSEAKSITVRGRRSMHCPMLDTSPFFQEILQCLLDRIALATMEKKGEQHNLGESLVPNSSASGDIPNSPNSVTNRSMTKRPQADQTVAQDLLNMTMQCSPLDILLDP